MERLIDQDQFNEAVDGDQDVIEVIAQTYIDTYEDLYESFKSSYDSNDPEKLAQTSHTLKGAVSMFFAESLTGPLEQIELNAKAGKISIDESEVIKIKEDLNKLSLELKELIKN
ncbi:MAG: hypothetical protein CME64_06315 [Halobacteriovoraceae bacterium]|nr:hypothetical protein [Halobacteriovoraceae bacterium]|tara:strand:- start:84500 stop:84841 length:342 start_codon:yes stop_codon:yes gene_type:complete